MRCEPIAEFKSVGVATMLEKIQTFDPEVPGLIFWPVMFGIAFALGLLIATR
jgi:hypothetical protein